MKQSSHIQIFAMGLRAGALILRFGIIFLVARLLQPADAGYFMLYYAGIQLSSSLLTLDVYADVTRRLIARTQASAKLVGLQLGVIALASLIGAPFALFLYATSVESLPYILLVLFIPQTIFELIANDLGRLLIPLGRPFVATALTFLRSALWVLPLGIFVAISDQTMTFSVFAITWLFASICSAVFAFYYIVETIKERPHIKFDLGWIWEVLKLSAVFFLGSLFLRVVMGVDRFLVENALGIEAVAVYGSFVAVAFSLSSLLETGVSAWYFPRMTAAIEQKDRDGFSVIWRKFVFQNSVASVMLAALITPCFAMMALFFLPELYINNINAFYVIMLGTMVYGLSVPFYYVVYAFRQDFSRLLSFGLGALVLVLMSILILPEAGLVGAAIMIAAAFSMISVVRIVHAVWLLANWRSQMRAITPASGA